MELLQLKYFCSIAEHSSVTAAARALYVSQPALSRALATLETELGIRLFDRAGRTLHLNAAGKYFYQRVSPALRSIDTAARRLQQQAGEADRTAVINLHVTPFGISEMIMAFHEAHPDLKLQFARDRDEEAVFDLSIGAYMSDPGQYSHIHLYRDEMVLAVSVAHPLAGRQRVTPAELSGLPIIAAQPGAFSPYNFIERLYTAHGLEMHIQTTAPSSLTTKTLIEAGQGVSFFPRRQIDSLYKHDLVLLSIDSPHAYDDWYLIWPKGDVLSPAAKTLAAFMQEFYQTY